MTSPSPEELLHYQLSAHAQICTYTVLHVPVRLQDWASALGPSQRMHAIQNCNFRPLSAAYVNYIV